MPFSYEWLDQQLELDRLSLETGVINAIVEALNWKNGALNTIVEVLNSSVAV